MATTRLSVNINKIAWLRNARGGNDPDLLQAAKDIEGYGAEGITVHPRPDERHITYKDAYNLKPIVTTEYNIEGNPNSKFLNMVLEIRPHQCTLVPDAVDQLTSDHGWDTLQHQDYLKDVIQQLKDKGIRVSLFVDPIEQFIEGAKEVGADRIELYTGPYAHMFQDDHDRAIQPYIEAARYAQTIGLGVNAGHDLNLDNLKFFNEHIPELLEVSIGHALISDALYFGLQNSIQMYLHRLR